MRLLATNQLGTALYPPLFEGAISAPNTVRFIFVGPKVSDFYPDWFEVAQSIVAVLKSAAGETHTTNTSALDR